MIGSWWWGSGAGAGRPRWVPAAAALVAIGFCCSGMVTTTVLAPFGLVGDAGTELVPAAGNGGCGPGGGRSDGDPDSGGVAAVAGLDTEQLTNAELIIRIGAEAGVPPRGLVIAVATAMQESGLRNLPHLGEANDHDSLGLFQQRPSQGWGTPEQLRDPAYATLAFYQRLISVDGWESMPLAQAAQAVQRSAHPQAYTRHEPAATAVVLAVAAAHGWAPAAVAAVCPAGGPWTRPVAAPVGSGFRPPQRPDHDGVDLGAARGTPVLAASAGTMTVVRCNVVPADHGCDRDGSPALRGCGWYVDIAHPGGVVTRYCHLGSRPLVPEGQPVVAGQVIGRVGSSGGSSGPHLHFEVHVAGRPVDPVAFMRDRGAPLGVP